MRQIAYYVLTAILASVSSFAWSQASVPMDNQPEPTVILVPIVVTDSRLESGCWAQFYDKREFKGDFATLVGPSALVSLDKGTARALRKDIDSLVVGPKATLTLYQHVMFKDSAVKFDANSREPGLLKKLGFGGRIQSMKLECSN